jgi:type IV pilus biogenesis protein CpaD/CtpE
MRNLLLLMVLAGCSQVDPYTRDGMWQPNGANSLNLAAMVSDPRDLLRGHGETGAQPVQSAMAVDRLLTNTAKPLLPLDADAAPGSGAGQPGGAK